MESEEMGRDRLAGTDGVELIRWSAQRVYEVKPFFLTVNNHL